MDKTKDQVQLSKLVFTHNWEDPISDYEALKIKSQDEILAITSGGCNVLGFLQFDPKIIYSIDINAAQSYLLELKIAAIKTLNFDEFIKFSGLLNSKERLELFKKVELKLSEDALRFWKTRSKILENGFIMNGKYEGFVKFAGLFIKILQGKKRVSKLFAEKTQKQQEEYFDTVWDTKQFKYMFKLLFNKHMLAKRGLVADYFHFDDGSTSFAQSFYNRSKKAFRDLPIKGNYFLSLYLLGKYSSLKDVPDYLKREHFDTIKARIDRIKIITSDAQGWINTMEDKSIDCFSLSNICELMSEDETERLFSAVKRTARNNSRVIFRNLMIPREVPEKFKDTIIKDEPLSNNIYNNDRSFVYGKVAAYNIVKK